MDIPNAGSVKDKGHVKVNIYNVKGQLVKTLVNDNMNAGGLDHISKTKKFFVFHDIGCNGKDNSFRIGEGK